MSVIGIGTGFGELFHAAKQGIGAVLSRIGGCTLSKASKNRINTYPTHGVVEQILLISQIPFL
jgi:hypothetical protein